MINNAIIKNLQRKQPILDIFGPAGRTFCAMIRHGERADNVDF